MHVARYRAAIALLWLFTALIGFLSGARAEDYPNRPVRLITDSAPGSAIDVPVRLIAEGLSRIWGQQAGGRQSTRRRRRDRGALRRNCDA